MCRVLRLSFKIKVNDDLFDAMEAKYAPPDHPVFQLVPEAFGDHAQQFYEELGDPDVNSFNFWSIYQAMLAKFEDLSTSDIDLTKIIETHNTTLQSVSEEVMDMLPGLKEYDISKTRASIGDPSVVDGAVMDIDLEDNEDATLEGELTADDEQELEVEGTLEVEMTWSE